MYQANSPFPKQHITLQDFFFFWQNYNKITKNCNNRQCWAEEKNRKKWVLCRFFMVDENKREKRKANSKRSIYNGQMPRQHRTHEANMRSMWMMKQRISNSWPPFKMCLRSSSFVHFFSLFVLFILLTRNVQCIVSFFLSGCQYYWCCWISDSHWLILSLWASTNYPTDNKKTTQIAAFRKVMEHYFLFRIFLEMKTNIKNTSHNICTKA